MATKLWSHIAGKRGVSRVRTYQRPGGAPLQIEWYLGGARIQRSLRYLTGEPILDRKLAVRIADRMAEKLEQGHNQNMREILFGVSPHRTLRELLDRLHADRGPVWSSGHGRDQARFRAFWLSKLGDVRLLSTNAAMVEAVAGKEARERGWSPRTHGAYLRYMVDAFGFAERKLKWIEPRHNLSAVDVPSPKSKGRSYTVEEIGRILRALEDVDPVACWIGHVLWQTGRRLTAARTLPKTAVTLGERLAVIRWPEETDKAGKEGQSAVLGRAFELTRDLMRRPGAYVAGPEPASRSACEHQWMLAAEKLAGVPHVPGRAWHGIKRRYSTASKGLKGRDRQSGTSEGTLRNIYEVDDDMEAKVAVATALAEQVGAL